MKPKLNATYFIEKFSKIPPNKWCAEDLSRREGFVEQRCAMGWCNSETRATGTTVEAQALKRIFDKHLKLSPKQVNDNKNLPANWGNNPRERILHALELIKTIARPTRTQFQEILDRAGIKDVKPETVTERVRREMGFDKKG